MFPNFLYPLRFSTTRDMSFAFLAGLALVAFWTPLSILIQFSLQREYYSHIILVPLVSTSVLLLDRRKIFAHVETCWRSASGFLFAGALLYWLGCAHPVSPSENDRLSTAILSLILIWIGEFVLCYGTQAFRVGLFPVVLLFLMVPIPDFLLERVILWLQTGSAEVSYATFQMVGIPVSRTGFLFSLPGVTIEVGSGIRSSLALLIISLLAGHLFLQAAWTKAVFTLATFPLLIVKNGIRIVTLSLLSIYVDPRFLAGRLHRNSGILFFLLVLALLLPLLRLLQKSELIRSLKRTDQDVNGLLSGAQPRRCNLSYVVLVRGAGLGTILRKTAEHTYWTRVFLGLRCDLASLPPVRPAQFEITIKPCDSATFPGLLEESGRVSGPHFIDVFLRQAMCNAGVQTLYVGTAPDGSLACVQWLVTARDQGLLHSHQPGRYPTLAPDEILIEGVYTFWQFRRTGVMTNSLAQLLRIAQGRGARGAFAYVASDNAPSLRTFEQVGFGLDHVRMNKRRLGLTLSEVRPVDEGARRVWIAATSPRT
jgi:exosortase